MCLTGFCINNCLLWQRTDCDFTCKIYVQERGMLFMYVHICRMNKVKSFIFRIKLPINVLILIVISFRMERCLQFLTSVKHCLDSLPVKQRTSFAQKGSLIPHTQENFTKCRVWRNQTIIAVLIIKTIENPSIGFFTILAIERNHDFSGFSGRAWNNFVRFAERPEKLRTYCYWRFCFSAFLGAGALLVAVGYSSCDKRDVAVVLLSLAVMFTGLSRAGYIVNHIDFAPR